MGDDRAAGTSSRRLWRYAGLLIGIGVFLVAAPIATRQQSSYDGVVMERVAIGLADHLDPLVRQTPDEFKLNTPYSNYGIGTSVVMAPLRVAARAVGGDARRSMNAANALLVGATSVAIFELLRRRGVTPKLTLLTTGLIVLGSPLLAYAFTDFSEPGVALMVALVMLGLDGVTRSRRYAAAGIGAAVGGAVLFRTDSLLLIGVPVVGALIALSKRRLLDLALFALGALPFMGGWLWYNAARFDAPFGGGYAYQGFTHPFAAGLYGLTFSPSHGVFVYAPLLIVAFVVVPMLRGPDRVLGILAVVLLIARVVLYARWWAWFGGGVWGPRFLVPVFPAFAPVIAAALQRWPRSRWITTAVAASVAMSLLGVWVTTHPARNPYFGQPVRNGTAKQIMAELTDPAYVRRTDHVMFDWSRFPFR